MAGAQLIRNLTLADAQQLAQARLLIGNASGGGRFEGAAITADTLMDLVRARMIANLAGPEASWPDPANWHRQGFGLTDDEEVYVSQQTVVLPSVTYAAVLAVDGSVTFNGVDRRYRGLHSADADVTSPQVNDIYIRLDGQWRIYEEGSATVSDVAVGTTFTDGNTGTVYRWRGVSTHSGTTDPQVNDFFWNDAASAFNVYSNVNPLSSGSINPDSIFNDNAFWLGAFSSETEALADSNASLQAVFFDTGTGTLKQITAYSNDGFLDINASQLFAAPWLGIYDDDVSVASAQGAAIGARFVLTTSGSGGAVQQISAFTPGSTTYEWEKVGEAPATQPSQTIEAIIAGISAQAGTPGALSYNVLRDTPAMAAIKTFGTSFPNDAVPGALHELRSNVTLDRYTLKLSRTGDILTGITDFAAGDVAFWAGSLYFSAAAGEATYFTALGAGDKVVLKPQTGENIVLTLSHSPAVSEINGVDVVTVGATHFSVAGTVNGDLVDGMSYTVYPIHVGLETAYSEFRYDGAFWAREIQHRLVAANVPNNLITHDMLAPDSVGNSELQDGVVGTIELQDRAVTGAKIENYTVGHNNLMADAVRFGSSWVRLFHSDNGIQSAPNDNTLTSGSFAPYTWLMFVARAQWDDQYRFGQEIAKSYFQQYGMTMHSDSAHCGLRWVSNTSFRLQYRAGDIRFHEIWGRA